MGGAVNTPSAEMVPSVALPPAITATLQVTPVLDAFETVAASARVFPSSTDALDGVTLTEIGGGVGGEGGGAGAVAPAHPASNAQSAVVRQTNRTQFLPPFGASAPSPCAGATACDEAMCLPARAWKTASAGPLTPAHLEMAAQRLNTATTAGYRRFAVL